jgi:hypothetical protein
MLFETAEKEMTKQLAGLTTIVVLALSIGAFVGSALAGNGHGNGNAPESPGNSANAPGQLKQDESGADANASAAQAGVKPTDSTAHGNHNTSCTTGGGTGSSATCASSGSNAATAQTAAHADASKRYGNGSTAAQIANGNGAPAGTTVYGPGNSQPHKVTDCKHKHAVDVHAVKSYSSAACTQQAASSTGSTSHTSNTINTSHTTVVAATGTTAVTGATGASTPMGGVLGATAAAGKGSAQGGPQGGVLGALAAVGQGSLPFTGFPLWIAVAAALGLIVLGLALHRHTRVTA